MNGTIVDFYTLDNLAVLRDRIFKIPYYNSFIFIILIAMKDSTFMLRVNDKCNIDITCHYEEKMIY